MSLDHILSEIGHDLQSVKDNPLLYLQQNFESRAKAIDFIDFHIIDRIDIVDKNTGQQKSNLEELKLTARGLKKEFEAINQKLFCYLRETIKTQKLSPNDIQSLFLRHLENNRIEDCETQQGYDYLDELINGVFYENAMPEPSKVREPEMIFYQQTPARIIFKLAEMLQVGGDGVLYDLGSGLGYVPILINLLSGNKTVGVEFEPAYHQYARVKATQLKLSEVDFINKDARNVNYTNGSAFYFYTPFEGGILQEVLDKLKQESLQRSIRLFSYGRCSFQLAKQSWLMCSDSEVWDIYKLYEFRSDHSH